MDTNGDWVRCVLWINKSRRVLCFVLAPGNGFCEILSTLILKSFFKFYFGVSFFFTVRIILLYFIALDPQ